MKSIEVVAAIICDEAGRVFATQRGYGEWKDWWEVPGGKMEAGETPEQALRREIREELAAEIEVGKLLHTVNYDYSAFHLTMHCFMCRLLNREQGTKSKEQGKKTAVLKEQRVKNKDSNSSNSQFTLLEHEAAKWLAPSELHTVRWLPADEEIIEILSKR